MVTFFSLLIILASILLVAIVFIQNPKGGGLAGDAGSQQLGGVQRTNDFVEKATWVLAAIVLISAIAVVKMTSKPKQKAQVENTTGKDGKGGKGAPKKPTKS